MILDDNTTPVVVLVSHHHVGIGIARSLGRLGVPLYGIDADRYSPMLWSRFCRGHFIWDLHHEPADASLEFLRDVGRRIGRRALLVPTSDVGAMLLAEHADQLSDNFLLPKQKPGLIPSLCSKREMYHLARQWNVNTPETSFPQSRHDVLNYLDNAQFPILVKPIFNFVPGLKFWRMSVVSTKDELLRRYDEVEDAHRPNVMLQEYIPGGDEMTWTFNGYFDRQGQCRVAFTGRKLRNFPAYFGQASLAACARNDYVKETTIAFMRNIGYTGPLDLGYRYDARDQKYKVNDINPRIGAMFRVFVGDNGMDVVRAFYQDMTGQPVTATAAPENRKWIVEDVDLLSSLRYWRDGRLGFRDWLRSLRGIDETAFFAVDDPMPLLAALMMDVHRGFGGRSRPTEAAPAAKPTSDGPALSPNLPAGAGR